MRRPARDGGARVTWRAGLRRPWLPSGTARLAPADPQRWTPLHYAASRGHVEVVRELVGYGVAVDIMEVSVSFGGEGRGGLIS